MTRLLRAEPAFARWVAAEGVSMLGTSITTVALPLVVFEATGSTALTGALFALRVVPYLLFGVLAGPLADRGDRRRLIIGGNVAEGLLVATIPIAHVLGVLTVAQVYVVAVLAATAFVFSDAAVFGAVPALVGPARLPAANGLLVVGFGNSFAFGAVLGLLVPYAVDELGLGAEDARIGLLYGAVGAGSLISGLLFAHPVDAGPIGRRGPRAGRDVGLDPGARA